MWTCNQVVSAVVLCACLGYATHGAVQDVTHQLRYSSTTLAGARSSDQPQFSNHPDITQIVTSRPAFSSDFSNVRQDAPLSEDELQRSRRATSVVEAEDDDSDMYMEPLEETGQATPTEADSDGMSQHFFPSFAPVFSLGHSRPPQLFHQEPLYTKPTRAPQLLRPEYNPFRAYRDNSFKQPLAVEEDVQSQNVLGSGNFGVITGGTYYNDEDRDEFSSNYSPYYNNNGHGRPAFIGNPRPQKYNNGDIFANFRDFADINTPSKASFSEYVIVYVNKNASRAETSVAGRERPKNIIEQLTLLDEQDRATEKPPKKTSSHKRKLAALRDQRTSKESRKLVKKTTVSSKELTEPLLAVS